MEAPDTGDEGITHAALLHPPQEEAHQEDLHAAPRFTRAATSVPPAEVTADREAASCWPSYLPSPGPALPAQLVPRQGQGWPGTASSAGTVDNTGYRGHLVHRQA